MRSAATERGESDQAQAQPVVVVCSGGDLGKKIGAPSVNPPRQADARPPTQHNTLGDAKGRGGDEIAQANSEQVSDRHGDVGQTGEPIWIWMVKTMSKRTVWLYTYLCQTSVWWSGPSCRSPRRSWRLNVFFFFQVDYVPRLVLSLSVSVSSSSSSLSSLDESCLDNAQRCLCCRLWCRSCSESYDKTKKG
jgi:hypothetical protein